MLLLTANLRIAGAQIVGGVFKYELVLRVKLRQKSKFWEGRIPETKSEGEPSDKAKEPQRIEVVLHERFMVDDNVPKILQHIFHMDQQCAQVTNHRDENSQLLNLLLN